MRRWRRDGTLDIVAGSIVAGLAAYGYEIAGGRALGAHGFAAVSALLTIHFLAFVVVLLPLEQVVIRRLTLEPDRPGVPVAAVGLVLAAAIGGGVVAWLGRGRLFGGDAIYALLVVATVLTHGGFALARGYLAGRRRFRSYGMTSAAAALVRLAIAGVVLALAPGGVGLGVALVVGPLAVLAWGPLRKSVDDTTPMTTRHEVVDVAAAESHLLAGLMLASAASQALLLGGPIVVAARGATPALVSTVFVTFTLFRAPLTLGYNLIARLLPPLTAAAGAGEAGWLAGWGRRIGVGAALLAVPAAATGWWAGPAVVGAVFGEGFRPGPVVAASVAAGVVLAAGALLAGQIQVARGDAARLADAWLLALATAGIAFAAGGGDPATRVAVAFVCGEAAALLALVFGAMASPAKDGEAHRRRRMTYPVVKRLGDLLVAGVGAVAAVPLAIVVAMAIRVDSPGPVLLRQVRVGRGGAPFAMWKFRTMHYGADPDVFAAHLDEIAEAAERGYGEQPGVGIDDDPRVTRIGRSLRRWSLDELPNLLNVLRGDMSLVGPRPLVADEVGLIARELGDEAVRRRHSVAPGVTGLAQVRGRDNISLAARSALDLEYAAARSVSLDVWILLQTVRTVIGRGGR